MVEFKDIPDGLTIKAIFEYTYRYVPTRFDNADRDILPSKLKIIERRKYKRNKEGKFNTPEEFILLTSWSAPQYEPYSKLKSKKAKRQMTVKHHYDIRIAIQKTPEGIYDYEKSKMIWRVGSYKKPRKAPQNKVKTIYKETRERLERKYKKLSDKDKKIAIDKEIKKIQKSAPYLDNGDYNSQEFGIMLDAYYRDYYVQKKFGCLYGPCTYNEPNAKIDLPFADKHLISCILALARKGIIKVK